MVIFKSGKLNKKEEQEVQDIILDFGFDFNYFKQIKQLLKKGTQLIYSDEGFILVKRNEDKLFLNITAAKVEDVDKLLKIVNWNIGHKDLFVLIKKDNILKNCLYRNNFKNYSFNGDYIVLLKKGKCYGRID